MPQRIQRRRTKGWRMPERAVYVGRPTKWGNPYPADLFGGSREKVVSQFWKYLHHENGAELMNAIRAELRGKDLACWCPLDRPCHADVLLELANQ